MRYVIYYLLFPDILENTYNLYNMESCPSGLRCGSRKAVYPAKGTAGSNPVLSVYKGHMIAKSYVPYFYAATTPEHEKKLDYLSKKGFNLFITDTSGIDFYLIDTVTLHASMKLKFSGLYT